ncbi:MAG: glycosyltransferase family 4 protein [Candidatus Marinimicrobia bacterium]|nr:glycosyltransferase family 4 protein [Candidatus Neomarinimicrobiota bacterium]
MKIIFVANTSWYLYNFRKPLIVELLNLGYKVYTISPEDSYTKKLINLGVLTNNISIARSGLSPIKDVSLLIRLVKLYANIKPDIIHHFTVKPVIYGSYASRSLKNSKIINSIPGLGIVFSGFPITRLLVIFLYRLAISKKHQIIFQNPDDLKKFLDFKIVTMEQSSLIMSSGVDTEYFRPNAIVKNRSQIKFGLMARLLWSKGISEFVKAGHLLHKINNNTEFIILGNPDKDSLDSVSYEWLNKINESYTYIHWREHVDDVKSFLNEIDVFVLPSYYPEGVPKSLIEAASMKLPIITTKTPGCKEVVADWVNGILVPAKDIKALSIAMQTMAYDEKRRFEMGVNSRNIAKTKFSIEKVNKKTRYLYFNKNIER